MKKIVFLALISLFFLLSCSEKDPQYKLYDDEDAPRIDLDADDADVPAADDGDLDDGDGDRSDEESAIPDETDGEIDDADDEIGDETPDVSFEAIGQFDLNFDGQINSDFNNLMAIKGGKGEVSFTYNGETAKYGELDIFGKELFPLATIQGDMVSVLWLKEAPSLGGGESKQEAFAFTFPTNAASTESPSTMEAETAFAFFGDVEINIQNAQFSINCVRAVAPSGTFHLSVYDETKATFTANGDLLDPSAAPAFPYPACE